MRPIAFILALAAAAPAAVPVAAIAQPAVPAAPVQGVRLEIAGVGEVARTPDLVTISAGVVTRAPQAQAALRDNAARMERVRAALSRLGVPARDIQTGSILLGMDYESGSTMPGRLERSPGFTATNQLTIRFRDVAAAGPIIDALVAEGANSVQGPVFGVADEAAALDEARTKALAAARARAELYARALGTRIRRIVGISETPTMGMMAMSAADMAAPIDPSTRIEPGQRTISMSLNVVFELEQPGG